MHIYKQSVRKEAMNLKEQRGVYGRIWKEKGKRDVIILESQKIKEIIFKTQCIRG